MLQSDGSVGFGDLRAPQFWTEAWCNDLGRPGKVKHNQGTLEGLRRQLLTGHTSMRPQVRLQLRRAQVQTLSAGEVEMEGLEGFPATHSSLM